MESEKKLIERIFPDFQKCLQQEKIYLNYDNRKGKMIGLGFPMVMTYCPYLASLTFIDCWHQIYDGINENKVTQKSLDEFDFTKPEEIGGFYRLTYYRVRATLKNGTHTEDLYITVLINAAIHTYSLQLLNEYTRDQSICTCDIGVAPCPAIHLVIPDKLKEYAAMFLL